MRREQFERTLKGSKGNVNCVVSFTHSAWVDCDEQFVQQLVAADLVKYASEYLLAKKEMERFTIVSENDSIVVTGIVTYKDDLELELKLTNIYTDVYFVKNRGKEHFQVD